MSAVRRLAAVLVTALGSAACTTTTAIVEPAPRVTELDTGVRPFLREPLLGYEGNIAEQSRHELAEASAALARGEVQVARGSAETLLGIDPTLLPATVLLAQTHLAAGENELALDLLATALAARPGYTAGQLVHARAAERTGDAVAAYRAYRGIAAVDDLAAERAAALEGDAVAELSGRVAAAIDAGGFADAAAALEVLRAWAPGAAAAVDLGRRLARARGDTVAELAATRELVAADGASLEVLHRQAALELEAGDARRGLELYEQLAQRHPGNAEIAAGLTAARFTWRTRLLPESVRKLFEASSLLRGDFAALTAWLVPGIRTGPAGGTVIVSDILEHPHRREIARLLNLGLMEPADAAVRRFGPNNYMRRGPALATLLRMPGRIGGGAGAAGGGGAARRAAGRGGGGGRAGGGGRGRRLRGRPALPTHLGARGVPPGTGDLGTGGGRSPAPGAASHSVTSSGIPKPAVPATARRPRIHQPEPPMTAAASSATTLDRERAIVLVIDLQGRLVDLMDRSRMLLDGTARLLRLAQLFELPVIVTEQYPRGLGSTREEVEAAIRETDPDGSRTRRVEKDSFGCCGVPAFEEALEAARPGLPPSDRQVVVAGIEAHICVVQTVLDLRARGTDVHVCWDCVSSRGEEYRRHALERMGNAGAQITNHESVAFELARDKNHPQFKGVNRLLREGQIA